MRSCRSSGSVEGVVSNHDPYSDPFSSVRRQARLLHYSNCRGKKRPDQHPPLPFSMCPTGARVSEPSHVCV